MTTREELYRMVDRLAESHLPIALQFLEGLKSGEQDPVLRALLLAPWDDEPETEKERAAVEEAREELRQGHFVTHEEMKRQFGL